MLTDVVEGPYATVFLADDENRFPSQFRDDVVAGLRDVELTPAQQPHFRPQALPFQPHEITIEIAPLIDDVVGKTGIGSFLDGRAGRVLGLYPSHRRERGRL